MTSIALGFWLIYRTKVFEQEKATAITRILTDPRWPWQPNLIRPTQRPGQQLYPWPRHKIAQDKLSSVVKNIVQSYVTDGITLSLSRKEMANNSWVHVDNGRESIVNEGFASPYCTFGFCRSNVPAGKSIEAWLDLVRELAIEVDATNGIVSAEVDERILLARIFVQGREQARLPGDHPANESPRVNAARRSLGDQYVRLPSWGTFLRPTHVEAIGGRARLLDVVQPPVVQDVGDLLYVQLSTNVADALAPETEARRRAFADLLAPITVPQLT
jgi:hypothetical protein